MALPPPPGQTFANHNKQKSAFQLPNGYNLRIEVKKGGQEGTGEDGWMDAA